MKSILRQGNNILIPKPKTEIFQCGTSKFEQIKVSSERELDILIFSGIDKPEKNQQENLNFFILETLKKEEYILEIKNDKCVIKGGTERAFLYGAVTLKSLILQYGIELPNMYIRDWPDLEIRGVMLDVSRDKTPKLETLFKIIDVLRDVKINHFQLYIEGFSFEYESFKELWSGKETPLTMEEIKKLEKYCDDRGIELVGNQNCFGHMDVWLKEPRYKMLAENFEEIKVQGGLHSSAGTTLNPINPKSFELVEEIFNDIVPYFSSKLFNVNLDEPYELGTGKSKKIAEKIGVGNLYLEYSLKIHESMKKRGKQMMMWGDIIYKNPEIGNKFPKDIIMLEWGYSAYHPFEKHALFFQKSGNKFILCPGTSSWGAVTGRTESMLINIKNACKTAVKYGALGIINTEWGNCGHMQTPAMSYPGHVLAGALSWNSSDINLKELEDYLSLIIYRDKSLQVGKIIMDFGRYRIYEDIERDTRTMAITSFERGIEEKDIIQEFKEIWESLDLQEKTLEKNLVLLETIKSLREFRAKELIDFIENLYKMLKKIPIEREDAKLIFNQYKVAKEIIVSGTLAREYLLSKDKFNLNQKKNFLKNIKNKIDDFIPEYEKNWKEENKLGGMSRSVGYFYRLKNQIEKEIEKN